MDPLAPPSSPPSSSPRIMAAFEMLVARLSNLEAEARAQRRASELRDDLSGPGMLAGILDAGGERPFALFKGYSGLAEGLVFVNSYRNSDIPSLFGGDEIDHDRHRPALVAAWGKEVAERALAAEAHMGDGDTPSCEDVGCPPRHEHVFVAVQEAILRAGFPGVAERLVPNGIWLRLDKPTGVRDILRLLRAMAALLGQPGPDEFVCDGEEHIKVFRADYWGERFLMSVSDRDATWGKPKQLQHLRRLKGDWWRLPLDDRERIRREAKHRGSLAAELLDSYDIAELAEA